MKSRWTPLTIFLLFGFAVTLTFSGRSSAELIYSYQRMATKNLDDMNKIIKEKIKEATKDSKNDEVDPAPLREALQAIFSRPNSDGMIDKVLDYVKNRFADDDQWEEAMELVVDDSLNRLKVAKENTSEAQATDVVLLTNVVAEFKPKKNEDFEGKIIRKIRDAKIKLSHEARAEGREKTMIPLESPSEFAESILPAKDDKKAKKEAEKKIADAEKADKEKAAAEKAADDKASRDKTKAD